MERSTHGIPEREGYSLKWSIGRVFVQNVPAMAVEHIHNNSVAWQNGYPQIHLYDKNRNLSVFPAPLMCRNSFSPLHSRDG